MQKNKNNPWVFLHVTTLLSIYKWQLSINGFKWQNVDWTVQAEVS